MDANEPANPCPISMGPTGEICFPQYSGLTKRELVAAMMMQGMISDPSRNGDIYAYAKEAIIATDALIAELSKAKP